ncbi:MAG: hypothetical protein J6C52_01565 [Clostridia bacterium]|nr:hypothetical protein [Clostridia bacterium]
MQKIAVSAVIFLAAAALLADLAIRSLGALVRAFGAADLAPVFDQLQHAEIIPGVFLAAIPAALFAWIISRVTARAGKIALGTAGIFIAWLAALWSASVNSIMLGDIIKALVRLIRAGALELL